MTKRMRVRTMVAGVVALVVAGCGGVAHAATVPARPGAVGIDISHPQAGSALPAADFAVVGVNGDNFGEVNPDFARQWSHALALKGAPALYLVPANVPGGLFWGKGGPEGCDGGAEAPASAACAYDYGWTGAQQAVAWARAGGLARGQRVQWWIDIENDATWDDSHPALNAAVVRGVRDALRRSGTASSVGIYALSAHWRPLFAPTPQLQAKVADLASLPVWANGGSDTNAGQARRICVVDSPTGGLGPIVLGQSAGPDDGISVDVVCPVTLSKPARMTARGRAVLRGSALPGTVVRVLVQQRGRSAKSYTTKATAAGTWALTVPRLAPKVRATARVVGGPSVFVPSAV